MAKLNLGDKVVFRRPGLEDTAKNGTIVGMQRYFLWRYSYAVKTGKALELVEPGDYIVKLDDGKEELRKTRTAKQVKSATPAKPTRSKSATKCAKRKEKTA